MRKISISIPNPCLEDWRMMSPTEKGRFCTSCAKEVIDFSVLDDKTTDGILASKPIGQICGRFNTTQLTNNTTVQQIPTRSFDLLKVAALLAILPLSDHVLSQTQPISNEVINVETLELSQTIYPGKDSLTLTGIIKDTVNKVVVKYAKIEVKDRENMLTGYSEFDGRFTLHLPEGFWQRNENLKLTVAAETYEEKSVFFTKSFLEKTRTQNYDVVVIIAPKPDLRVVGVVQQKTMGVPVHVPVPVAVSGKQKLKAWIFHPIKMMRYRKNRR